MYSRCTVLVTDGPTDGKRHLYVSTFVRKGDTKSQYLHVNKNPTNHLFELKGSVRKLTFFDDDDVFTFINKTHDIGFDHRSQPTYLVLLRVIGTRTTFHFCAQERTV